MLPNVHQHGKLLCRATCLSTSLAYDPGHPCYRHYQRYSSEKQGFGESLARQVGEGDTSDEALAVRFGLPLGTPMVDRALSGFRGANLLKGAFADYLKLVKARRIPEGDIIGLDEWSRLTRLPLDESSHLLTTLITAGVGLYIKKHDTLINRTKINGATGFHGPRHGAHAPQTGASGVKQTKSRYNRTTIAIRHRQAAEQGIIRSLQVPAWLQVVDAITGPSGVEYEVPSIKGTTKDHIAGRIKRRWLLLEGPISVIHRVFREALTRGVVSIASDLNRDWQAGDARCAPFGLKRKNGSAGWYSRRGDRHPEQPRGLRVGGPHGDRPSHGSAVQGRRRTVPAT